MEPPEERAPQEIADVSAIQNLDTARMTLRWALERLHKLEKDKQEFAQKAASEEKAKSRALEELSALERTLSLRAVEAREREIYYAKIEEFLSLRLAGKLDCAALAKRELEASQLQEILGQKQAHLEKDYAARRSAIEGESQRIKSELEQEARARDKRAEAELERRRQSLEQDHLSRMAELHEKQICLRQEEKALAERRAQFEDYYAAQRAQLQSQIKNFREEVEGQVDFRLQVAERILNERQASLEAGWTRERALLVKELENWRQKARELAERALELEEALAAAEEAGRQARSAANRQTLILEETKRAWQAERETVSKEAEEFKRLPQQKALELHQLRERLAAAEEETKAARIEAEGRASRLERQQAAWEAEKASLRGELEEIKAGGAADEAKAAELSQEKQALSRQLSDFKDELDRWKAQARESGERLAQAQSRLSAAEGEARRGAQASERLARLEAERQASEKELAEARGQLDEWREISREQAPRLMEMERSLAAVQEDAKRSAAAAEAKGALAQREKRSLEKELSALQGDLEGWKSQAKDYAAKLVESESALAAAQGEAQEARRQEDFLDNEKRSWEREGAALRAELEDWKRKFSEQTPRMKEMEKRLAGAEEEAHRWKARAAENAERIAEMRSRSPVPPDRELERALGAAQEKTAALEEEKRSLESELAGLKGGLDEFKRRREEEETRLREAEDRERGLAERERKLEALSQSLAREYRQKQDQLESLKEDFEGEMTRRLSEIRQKLERPENPEG